MLVQHTSARDPGMAAKKATSNHSSTVLSTIACHIRRRISHPSGPTFHARYLHGRNSADAEKVSIGNISPGASRRRIVRYWHPLGCRAIELGRPPQGGYDIHAPSYTARAVWSSYQCLQIPSMCVQIGMAQLSAV